MGQRGGKRQNSGRKKGSGNLLRSSPEIAKGILPLEMRLIVSRHMWAEAVDAETGAITDLAKAKEAAEFAEPALRFTSPALSAIDARVGFDLTALSDEDLDELDRIAALATNSGGDRGGEGEA